MHGPTVAGGVPHDGVEARWDRIAALAGLLFVVGIGGFGGFLLFLIWTLATSVVLLMRSRRHAEAII
jgi:hypothetical protein